MTDAHCHVAHGDTRHFLCDPCAGAVGPRDVRFVGCHPWDSSRPVDFGLLRARLASDPRLGVGEIGLDRLRERTIPPRMREVFDRQLELAAEFGRPVVLHGAKCWGEVVRAAAARAAGIPSFLFHGFSRSGGLLPDIVAMNGYVSIGPAILNDHAVNYRELAKRVPADRLLVETDMTPETAGSSPPVAAVAAKLAELRGVAVDALAAQLEANADAFSRPLVGRRSSPTHPRPSFAHCHKRKFRVYYTP